MKGIALSEIAQMCGGRLAGGDAPVAGVCTDTRRIGSGELFVALRGERFDGHELAAHAAHLAAGAMVEHELALELPQVVVDDTQAALGRLAAAWRARLDCAVIALTGSNGKTSVKEMLAAILARQGPTLATRGNLNNQIGVPLTLLALEPEHRYAVVEMGANRCDEIEYLTGLARPDVALVTNAGPAHLEGFGDLDGVARGKGEIFGGLGPHGTAVINADDAYADYWRSLNRQRRVVTFGLEAAADITAVAEGGGHWRLTGQGLDCPLALALPGRHNLMNALAAAAAARQVGADGLAISAGLAAVRPVPGRLEIKPGRNGSRIIDDSYNANPGSLAAAIATLTTEPGRHWLVLGDMAELGPDAEAMHRDSAIQARSAGVERLFAAGPLGRAAAQAFGPGGEGFDDPEALAEAVAGELAGDVTVLVKGSRSMHMEHVVAALVGASPRQGRGGGTGRAA